MNEANVRAMYWEKKNGTNESEIILSGMKYLKRGLMG